MKKEKKYIIKLTEEEIDIITDVFSSIYDLNNKEQELYDNFKEVLKIIKEKNKKTIDII